MLEHGLIQSDRLQEMFDLIEPVLIRYPALDPSSFHAAVAEFRRSAAMP